MIEYDSGAEKLERMVAAVGGGSNPEEGDGAEQETPPNVMGQSESRDPTSKIEVLGVAMLPENTSDVEVLGKVVLPEDTSGSLPPTEEPILGVVRSTLLLVLGVGEERF